MCFFCVFIMVLYMCILSFVRLYYAFMYVTLLVGGNKEYLLTYLLTYLFQTNRKLDQLAIVNIPFSLRSRNMVKDRWTVSSNRKLALIKYMINLQYTHLFPATDTVWCVDNVPTGGTNYVMVYNGGESETTIDNINIFRYACFVSHCYCNTLHTYVAYVYSLQIHFQNSYKIK